MKPIAHSYLTTGLALLALAACLSIPQVAAADSNATIATEQEFRETAVGKKLVSKHGYVIVRDDGTLTGEFGNKELTGTWNWEDEYYCRSAKLGKKDIGDDCQVVEVSGDGVIFVRKKGKGKKSASYQIEPES